jgi:hypothetical protein
LPPARYFSTLLEHYPCVLDTEFSEMIRDDELVILTRNDRGGSECRSFHALSGILTQGVLFHQFVELLWKNARDNGQGRVD